MKMRIKSYTDWRPSGRQTQQRLGTRIMQVDQNFRVELLELVEAGDVPVEFPNVLNLITLLPAGSNSNSNPHSNVNTSNDIFYYHTNHLGSTAFVTDNNATVTQGFLYAPFGEIIDEYVAIVTLSALPKYTFNAKELDEESGMYYYEARYMAPPTFISRDPLFEKYFWMSPYAYCANNPMKYVDPTGEKIVICYQNQQNRTEKLYFYKGNLYTDKHYTNPYIEGPCRTFAEDVRDDLKDIASKGGKLETRLITLVKSERTHVIKEGKGNHTMIPEGLQEGQKTGSTILYKRDSKNIKESISSLVHELLGHAYSADAGTFTQNKNIKVGTNNQEQINAIDIQNVYKKTVNIPLRTTDIDKNEMEYDISKYLNLEADNK